ncbi:MAG: biotin carboxylase N-terminal domain-containing protein, partial [Caulobacteraceae bacterium]
MKKLLIANRGEIAIRIARTAAELGIAPVAVYAEDDASSLHVRLAEEARPLRGNGPKAYLDIEGMIGAARKANCDAVHPGYGFLSENPDFARACEEAGLAFVGPSPETLDLFGDKTAALNLADELTIPTLAGTRGPTSLAEAEALLASLGPGAAVMIKALAGGGGRGMRPVSRPEDLAGAFARCASEAKAAFGDAALYVEQILPAARHVEVQILGDGSGAAVHLYDRECSLQRQRQKLIEIAPAVGVAEEVRCELFAAAVALARRARYRALGTIEFLVNLREGAPAFAFIEANARLQVEHPVTEQILGLDLVALQIAIASGRTLADLGLDDQGAVPVARGVAVEARVNLETMTAEASARPSGGRIGAYEPPAGPGIRVDGYGWAGYEVSPRYDSLLAKVIASGEDLRAAARRAHRALGEFRLEGVESNLGFLRPLLRRLADGEAELSTRYIESHITELLAEAAAEKPRPGPAVSERSLRRAGAKVDAADPLAVLEHGRSGEAAISSSRAVEPASFDDVEVPQGAIALRAPLQGTIVSLSVAAGEAVRAGGEVLIMESMKMEHVV